MLGSRGDGWICITIVASIAIVTCLPRLFLDMLLFFVNVFAFVGDVGIFFFDSFRSGVVVMMVMMMSVEEVGHVGGMGPRRPGEGLGQFDVMMFSGM